MTLEETLQRQFGFEAFLAGQREVMERVGAGESAAAIFPTGAGKSLCYQLPALHKPGLTLVVSPLLSLMKDQLEFLRSKKIPAAKLDSTMSAEDYRSALQDAKQGRLKILMIAVERFNNERFRAHLRQMNVSLLVVDEAHCISEWGHNFRPDYLKIPLYQRRFGIGQALLLTATATPKVIDDMCRKFAVPPKNVFLTGFYRKNLVLRVLPTPEASKTQVLKRVLSAPPAGPCLVYVTLQKTAEDVAEKLLAQGFDAQAYHAGLESEKREAIQNRFMAGGLNTIVATIAFGMGIDKRDIRKVVHYDLPKSMENYSQEIGRAGRDGDVSLCTVLADRNGVPVLENFIYGDTPEMPGIRAVLETIRKCPDRNLEVRLYEWSRDTDIRPLPLKTLLVYLEMDRILEPKYTYFENYPFKLLKTEAEIAANFQGERKSFVEALFGGCKTARVWTYPDMEAVVRATGSKRERVLAALEYFEERGWIELNPSSAVDVFEIVNAAFDLEATAKRLFDLFKAREAKDVERVHDMLRFLEQSACLAVDLSAYFGEHLPAACGRCSACRAGKPAGPLPVHALSPLESLDFSQWVRPLSSAVEPPLSPGLTTRFLCGITTPKLIRSKATKLAGFGGLSAYPYRAVWRWVCQNLKQAPQPRPGPSPSMDAM